ncbi:MAG: lysophospholipase [Pseudanabaena sp. ELA645]|jgi:pimeloyl-ACP methyl ester carboxylesterase
MPNFAPDFMLFAQHGWADTNQDIGRLARSLTSTNNPTYVPNLGWINTWLEIAPLIAKVEKIAIEEIATYPDLPLRIIAHSMGGLIWLEILNRHPEWFSKVHSLILIGSPVGGSDLGRLFDPLRSFPLMARDLGKNRRSIAEAIASQIPTASIVGDIGYNTDGMVPIGCSQFAHAHFVRLKGINHPTLKYHPQVATAIREFWANPVITPIQTDATLQIIAKLRSLDLTEISNRNFEQNLKYAKVIQIYSDGTKLWQWTNPLQITHVFVSVRSNLIRSGDLCVYSAYAGWQDKNKLAIALNNISSDF